MKLDELMRVPGAHNELIGGDDESRSQPAAHAVRLRERHRRGTDAGR